MLTGLGLETSGLALAGRLAENPEVTIAVLESGGETQNNELISMFSDERLDYVSEWCYSNACPVWSPLRHPGTGVRVRGWRRTIRRDLMTSANIDT